jgi:hypothetical protein
VPMKLTSVEKGVTYLAIEVFNNWPSNILELQQNKCSLGQHWERTSLLVHFVLWKTFSTKWWKLIILIQLILLYIVSIFIYMSILHCNVVIFYIYCIVAVLYCYCLLVSDDVVWNNIYIYLHISYSTVIGQSWIFEMYMKCQCKCKAGTPLAVQCSSSRTYCHCRFPTYQYTSSMHSLAACDWVHMPTVFVMIKCSCIHYI